MDASDPIRPSKTSCGTGAVHIWVPDQRSLRSLVRDDDFRHCEPTGRANARPMTGSAKQSILPREERMDCFVASAFARRRASADKRAPRNDEGGTVEGGTISRSRRMFLREVFIYFPPSPIRGRREAGRPMRPIAACAIIVVERTRVSQVTPESPGTPRAMVYGLFRALPGDRAFLPPSPAGFTANLTPASGRQDHTSSPSASAPFVRERLRVHRIPPRVGDVAQRPSVWDGMSNNIV